MVPAAFVVLDRFPLTTNGKLDRAALPAPETAALAAESGDSFIAPEAGKETALAGIWENVLGRNHIGRDSDFFAIGGTSLNALLVIGRVHRAARCETTARRDVRIPAARRVSRPH